MLKEFLILGFIIFANCLFVDTRSTCQLNNAGSGSLTFDANFSANACIVYSTFTAPDCSLAPPDYSVNATVNPCPGYVTTIAPIVDGGQIVYATMEDAIAQCPYGLIQFVGTIYMSSIVSSHNFWYNQSIDLTIQGFPQVIQQNNKTVIINSAIVGFKNLQVKNSTIQVTLQDLYLEGCETYDSIFLTRTPCDTCGTVTYTSCPGAWFRKNSTVLDSGFCQQTGAWFNGTQHIAFQNYTSITGDHYNGFHGSDAAYFNFADNITLEAWINPTVGVDHYYDGVAGTFRRSDSSDVSQGYGFHFENQRQGGYLRWSVKNPGKPEAYCRSPIPSGEWTHVAGTFSQGKLTMYVNGQFVCNTTARFTTLVYRTTSNVNGDNGIRPFTIGAMWVDKGGNGSDRNDHYMPYKGMIDEVRMWTVVRNPLQISAEMERILSSLTPNLVVYMRFDSDFGFKENWAKAVTRQPVPQFFNDFPLTGPDIWAVPDCFCTTLTDSCTPSLAPPSAPTEAVTSIQITDTINNYEYIVGELIDPNGGYGEIWLPGKTSTSGPIYNQVVRFVPGAYLDFVSPYAPLGTNTTNQFIPGVNLAKLPPFYYPTENPYLSFDYFLPGWFLNDGMAPFLGSNFFPGIFVSVNESVVPVPVDWEAGDLIFQPGYYFIHNGTWSPFSITSQYYIVPIILDGGIAFNATLDLDNCTNPGLAVSNTSTTTPVIEDLLNCNVGPTDIEPTYLNPLQRDPCFVLRDIRSQLPSGTSSVDPEVLLGCHIGPDDIEPTWLDPLNRNPCFVLRDIRAAIPVNETCPSGSTPIPPTYAPCLKNNNLTLSGVTIQNYNAEKVVCQWACDIEVYLLVVNSTFAGIPGSALWSSGLNSFDVHDSSFCPCGGATESCVYLNGNHVATGDFWLYNVRHCAIEDLLPISCSYDITPTLYCNQSQVYCLDVYATLVSGCPQVEVAPGISLFDSDCATYSPCTCGETSELVELPDGTFINITTNTADIVIPIEFATPSVIAFGNQDPNFITFPCSVEQRNVSMDYPCQVLVNETVIIGNVTITIPVLVDTNCTGIVSINVAANVSITCPCPIGYNISKDTLLTGTDAYASLGLYQTCEWVIPGGLPGEECLNGIVQCPYAGGTLGAGTPPPVPLRECDPTTGLAKIACSDCVGGFVSFEGYTHACPASCTAVNTTVTIFTVPCYCLDYYLIIPCTRSVCVNPTPCPLNDTLCAYYGTLTWDSLPYTCYVATNATDCIGIDYAPNYFGAVANGTIVVPCTDTYTLPGPGPCSCTPTIDSGNNVSIPCNATVNPNCTTSQHGTVYSDPSLQIICQTTGELTCRCDGINAINPFNNNTNFTLVTNSSGIWIDNCVNTTNSFYMQNVVTQQAPIGVRVTRVPDDNIWNFPVVVPHFWSGHFVIAELSRINQWVTGTRFDWVLGYDHQWNVRNCTSIYPATPDNQCNQYRPGEASSCVVDATYDPLQTVGFGTTRFNEIQPAVDNCPYVNIIIHKATNVYEEQIITSRSNMWIGSYDNAVIVSEGNVFTGDNITIRGITWIHPATSHAPIIQPGKASSNYLSALFDPSRIEGPPNEFRIYNCYFNGHNVNDAGVMVGLFGKNVDVSFNLFEGWYTRTIYINSPTSTFRLNTFRKCPGRAFFANQVKSIYFEENQCIDCTGMKVSKYLESFSVRAYGDIGKVHRNSLGQLVFQNFTAAEYDQAFDTATALAELSHDIGCNATYDSTRVCTYRGNKHITSDVSNTPQHSIICHALRGGAWDLDNVTDNTCNFARIGILFAYTPRITYLNRTAVSHRNFLVQPKLTLSSSITDGADQAYTSVGSLVSLGCSMPDCVADGVWPPLEVNPRCDLIITPFYGFTCMNNVTAAVEYGNPLNLIEVTSERARIRKDDMVFGRDAFVVGIKDAFCCQKPVIYASSMLYATSITVIETMELRFLLDFTLDEDPAGEVWMATPQGYQAGQIRFLDVDFDGSNTIGASVVQIASFHFDPATSVFQLQNCNVYNWWYLPDDTIRGVYTSVKGDTDVVVLPTQDLVFYEKRLPGVEGFHLVFKSYTTSTNRHVIKTTNNLLGEQNSMAIVVNNTFTNLDGNSIWIENPGNWEFLNNTFTDCGNRRPTSTEVVMLKGNMDSTGRYYCENNWWNTSKILLWAFGGGSQNLIRKSALTIQDLLFPFDFTFRNNTVVYNAPYDITLQDLTLPTDNIPPGDYGWFKKDGPKFLGGPKNHQDKVPKPFNKTADEVLQRSSNPKDLTGGDGTITEGIAYVNLNDTMFYMQIEGSIQLTPITLPYAGYPVGGRINVPPPVIYKIMGATAINVTFLFIQEPGLLPLMIVAMANNKDTARDYLAKGYKLPSNSPGGFEGISGDLVSCYGTKDYMENSLQQCNTCNDGCPIHLPPACLVDPQNVSFVPDNPYYGSWYFSSMLSAMQGCANPKREIWVYDQVDAYTEDLLFTISNWTLRSKSFNKTRVLVSTPVIFDTNDITLDGFHFLNNMGNNLPMMVSSGSPSHITVINCTFDGFGTTMSAIAGIFDSVAIVNNTFLGYEDSERVVVVESNCGTLVFQSNRFYGVLKGALWASNFIALDGYKNRFYDCGGAADAVAYVSICHDLATSVIWSKNIQYQTNYVVTTNSKKAAYWLDGVPLNNATHQKISVKENRASGLDIGLRVTNTDDITNSLNSRATIFFYTVSSVNLDCIGIWHYVVWSPIPNLVNDLLISQNPAATEKYWCDSDCKTNNGLEIGLIVIGLLLAVFFGWIGCTTLFCLANPVESQYEYSKVLGTYIAPRNAALNDHIKSDRYVRNGDLLFIDPDIPKPPYLRDT